MDRKQHPKILWPSSLIELSESFIISPSDEAPYVFSGETDCVIFVSVFLILLSKSIKPPYVGWEPGSE
jgi:hypothetical protein